MNTQRQRFLSYISAPDHETALAAHKLIEDAVRQAIRHLDDVTVDVGGISQDDGRDEKIRALANENHARDGEIEFDDGCVVSEGGDNGAYVQGWVWVPFSDSDLDKDREDDEDEDIDPPWQDEQ